MTTFAKGQQASITLDEEDVPTITGSRKLQITARPKPTYETVTNGGTLGPFGAVTAIILTGLGDGTFIQSPSNYPVAVTMVDMSPAQIAAPTAAQLAATNTLYQLNSPPYTIYQSNGTGMTVFGGGVSQYASLTDAATAPLPTTNTPLAAALATKQAALASGTNIKTINGVSILGSGDLPTSGNGATLVSFSTTIPLDGNNYSNSHTLTSNEAWTVGTINESASPSYYVEVVPNGYTPTFTGFLTRSGAWNSSDVMQVNVGVQNGRPQLILFDTGIPCAPVFSAQSAPTGVSGVAYSYTFVASAATSYAVASGTIPAGLSFNTSTGVLSGTPSSITSYTFVVSATNSNGTMNSTSQTVVINPPAPVFSAQSAPAGVLGAAYSYAFVASNTTSFAVASGSVPAGLTLNTSTGVLSGTPTTSAAYTFVIRATGTGGLTNSASQSVAISAGGRSDNFARANENPIKVPSDGGSAYFQLGNNSQMKVVSGKGVNNGPYNDCGSALTSTSADMLVSATFMIGDPSNTVSIWAHVQDTNNYGCRVDFSGTSLSCIRRVSASTMPNSAAMTVPAAAAGTSHTLTAQYVGSTLTVKLDETPYFSITETNFPAAASGGFGGQSTSDAAQMCTAFSIA